MSLINRMLSDLEERRGGNLRNVDHAIDGLRATPVPTRPRKKRIPPATLAMGLVIAGLIGLCAYLFLSRTPQQPVAPAVVATPPADLQPQPAAPAAMPAPAPGPSTTASAPAPAQPVVVTDVVPPPTAAAAPVQTTPAAAAPVEPPAQESTSAAWPDPAPVTEAPPPRAPRQRMLGKASGSAAPEPLVEAEKPAARSARKPAPDAGFHIAEAAPPPTADQAVALLEAGDTAGAEALLREGLADEPGNTAMARVMGHILLARNDAAGAVSALRPAAPPMAADPDFHALLAAAEQRSGAHEAAVRRYRGLLASNPGNGAWLVGLGISLQALGDTRAAADAFLQALADPALPAPLHDFAMQQSTQVRGQ